jgi:uncharacterized protein
MNTSEKSIAAQSLPRRLVVSLQVGGGFFALANIICVAILGYVYSSAKHEPKTLEVKGSAKKGIVSDTVMWLGTITARDPNLVKAYEKLKADADRVADFVKKAGIAEKEVTFSAISTEKIFQREVIPTPPKGDGSDAKGAPTVVATAKVEMYVLRQGVSVESREMEKVPGISRSITSLIKDGVEIESGSPRYVYSKLSELKIDMLAEATKDATLRATQIVSNATVRWGNWWRRGWG